jgi:hypothetical protein
VHTITDIFNIAKARKNGRAAWFVVMILPLAVSWFAVAHSLPTMILLISFSIWVLTIAYLLHTKNKEHMKNSGKATFMVGGAVRDRLLGREPNDVDYVVTGHTEEDMIKRGYTKVGAAFPVYLDEDGNEWALARTEKSTGPGYNDFEVDFNPNVSIEEDLYRRDFTINAIAYGIDGFYKGMHIDPYGGLEDLNNRIIRPVNPDAFRDDPVRIFRAARFAARYMFTQHPNIAVQSDICIRKGGLNHINAERIWLEFSKAVEDGAFSAFIENLPDGVLTHIGLASAAGNRKYNIALMERVDGYDADIVIPTLLLYSTDDEFNRFFRMVKTPAVHMRIAKRARRWFGVAEYGRAISPENLYDMLSDLGALHTESSYLDPVLTIFGEAWDPVFYSADTINEYINACIEIDGEDVKMQHPDVSGKELGKLIREYRVKAIAAIQNKYL